MAITTAQAEKLLRAEGRLARAKLREEVRNSVKDVMLRDGNSVIIKTNTTEVW
jgi:hypothetical protein